ncbi:MAG: 16S rRNA (cytosine(1402)-N(4))-methyltransferase RsmH, partial [Proteobacteria bacterium]|nr:16S rRNA (cytosine(1402)-N(4))-methyltransferase RsmH [Pseudomonadota bacterium]
GPLDMRMSRSGETAADVVNSLSEAELADIIFELGEERFARRVAREIVAVRSESPIETTLQLAEIARRVVRKSKDGIDPATRTFLALRIYVNDELGELDAGLRAAELLLAPGGRLAVVSFHSLEDRRVKRFLRSRSGAASAPARHQPLSTEDQRQPSFKLIGRNGSAPSAKEIAANPRARSARLRVAERTTAPAWPADLAA